MKNLIRLILVTCFNLIINNCGGGASGGGASTHILIEDNGATLSWVKPTQKVDKSFLTDLKGFFVYFGNEDDYLLGNTYLKNKYYVDNDGISPNMSCQNLNEGNKMTCTIDDLDDSMNWYFTVTAVNSLNIQSKQADIVCKQFIPTNCFLN